MKKENLIQTKFPIGSEWRRWDLHIHTPESKLGDSFQRVNWNEYISALETAAIDSCIAVIGITDYMTIDGYEKVYSAWKNELTPRLASVPLILPNIEFRAQPSTTGGKALNIHLLINPTAPDHITKIKQALRQLRFSYGGQSYGCIKDELIQFAKAQNAYLEGEEAYKFGLEQFKPSYDVITKWLRDDKWLQNNSLLGIANGKDGISALPTDGFSAIRDELLKNCDFIFSGNPRDREYYLGNKEGIPASKIIEMYRSRKPCVHGSDAHEVSKLFNPDEKRYCWIKADPTFEGLKQILWEPESRVHIGQTVPQPLDTSKVIKSITIENNGNEWFEQKKIFLNQNLIAIIGEKGGGKTAIADLLAFASGVKADDGSSSSFITKGRLHLNGTTVSLEWGGGVISSGTLTAKHHNIQRPLVRYLSQDFVERLCSDDHDGGELQQAIEEVVFARLDEVHREGFSSFSELRNAREAASESEKDSIRGNLASLHREVERLYSVLGQRSAKEATKKQTESQVAQLKEQLPTATTAVDQEVLKSLDETQNIKSVIEKEIASLSREKRAIEEIVKSYILTKESVSEEIENILNDAPKRLDDALISRFAPTWDATLVDDLGLIISNINKEIQTKQGNEELGSNNISTLSHAVAKIKEYQEALSKDDLNRKRLIDLQKQIASQESTVQRISKEIEELNTKTIRSLELKKREQISLYLQYFESLAKDEVGLQELYAPMKEQLNIYEAEMKFELSAGYHVGVNEWLEKANRFYDGRKAQATAKRDEIEKYVADSLAPAWRSGDATSIKSAFENFVSIVDPEEFMVQVASPSLKMVDLFDWMYSLDHVETTYKIQYGGISLEHLSPGTRGIALLVLYLLMDEDDRRPLIIDQPEGNLDNSSIYLQLVPYIRTAKEKRQIILVTHNPNLVVATDAEQIIIATTERPINKAYPRISYTSGSLEHNDCIDNKFGMRQAVCTLLEGGDRAFKEREGRYSLLLD